MKVLIIGSGGREHTLCWKIAESPRVSKVYCAPGNGGIGEIAENIDIHPEEIDELLAFATSNRIDLTIVGPEGPLAAGIVDRFKEEGLNIFGPNKREAQLEASKLLAKKFMDKYGIPTARYREYTNFEQAVKGLEEFSYPLVIKADGLCLGKGVVICNSKEEGIDTLKGMMVDRIFKGGGDTVIIEEFLEGIEMSLLCFVSRGKLIPMESAKDYKQIFEGDKGPNTGGVGSYSPNILLDSKLQKVIENEILIKVEQGLKAEKMGYCGILFIGLMIKEARPKVLEFNVRFGDPETEVLIPRLETDLVDLFDKTLDGKLTKRDLRWNHKACVTVVATSGGYPGKYEKNKEIKGLKVLDEEIMVFHNGTIKEGRKFLTGGGRVISLTALGDTIEEAKGIVYRNIAKVHFDGMYYRRDIGEVNIGDKR